MLISHRKKFIFTKTAKTAGTSVESFFEPYCMMEGEWSEVHARRDEYISEAGIIGARVVKKRAKPGTRFRNHMAAEDIKNLIGEEMWNDYFKFTVVRNPFSKMVSGFYHIGREKVKWSGTLRALVRKPGWIKYLLAGKKDIIDFRDWVAAGGMIRDRNKYLIRKKVCVDFFIRQEFLEEDVKTVCEKLGIDPGDRKIPRFKSQHRNRSIPIRDFYDAETEALVRERYAWEFAYFKYDMPA